MNLLHLRALAHVVGMVICGLGLMLARADGRDNLAALAAVAMSANAVMGAADWHRAGRGER